MTSEEKKKILTIEDTSIGGGTNLITSRSCSISCSTSFHFPLLIVKICHHFNAVEASRNPRNDSDYYGRVTADSNPKNGIIVKMIKSGYYGRWPGKLEEEILFTFPSISQKDGCG